MTPPKDEIFDFGFTFVSEEDHKAIERELAEKVDASSKIITKTLQDKNIAIIQLKNMVLPLLQNLAKDPDKQYIHWPDRAEKVKAFARRIEDFVQQSTQD